MTVFSSPLTSIFERFTHPNVPTRGAEEEALDPPFWQVGTAPTPPHSPGEGLARHPMLYIGEGCNRIFVINEGKVIWTYDTGKGWEYDDIWMRGNGNILFSRMGWAGEVTPEKQLIWRYDANENEELHTIQPIGPSLALMVVSGPTPYAVIVNVKTNEVEYRHDVPYDTPQGTHGQFRRFRMTAQGTFLVPYLGLGKVVEYDRDFRELWRYDIPTPWAAIRLVNGNTLITDEKDQLTREVTPSGETAWEFYLSELPEAYRLPNCQSCVRLKNGNTIFCSRGKHGTAPQLVEVTREKELVWVLNDWRELGPATAVQILNDPGDPDNPGECER